MDKVALHHVLGEQRRLHPVAHNRCVWRRQRHQLAQRARGLDLLVGRDCDVRDHDEPNEEAVAKLANDEQRENQREEDNVEEREGVAADDVPVGALPGAVNVGEPGRGPTIRLDGRETAGWRSQRWHGRR